LTRLFILTLVPILITCSHFAASSDTNTLIKETGLREPVPVNESTPVGLLLETEDQTDLALTLYKNAYTRDIVVEFYNSVTHSEEITRAVLVNAEKHSISPSLAFALCGVESRFNRKAMNQNQISVDRGLFQLNSRSFPELNEEDFFSVTKNAAHGMKHLRYCLDRGENEVVALAMYNAGETRVSGAGAPLMTLTYIYRILGLRDELENRFHETVLSKFSL
jgi:soluble lytic murein transglycosylase-like protein